MLNEVTLIGNVGKIYEPTPIPTGTVTHVDVATSRSWKDRNNTWHKETEWHKVVLFGSVGSSTLKKLQVGATVLVKGRIQKSEWTGQDGKIRKNLDIIANEFRQLAPPKDKSATDAGASMDDEDSIQESLPEYQTITPRTSYEYYDDDDIPF